MDNQSINRNPFEYEGANNLPEEYIITYYIEDYNFSRTIQSTKNIFLLGERGSGKTMTLLYNSYRIQYKKAKKEESAISLNKIGIYIPCNTPLFHKNEYEFLQNEKFKASIIGEHFLTLSVIYHICDTIEIIEEIREEISFLKIQLIEEFQYLLGVELKADDSSFFESLKKFLSRENVITQRRLNSFNSNGFYENAYTFSSLAIPFFDIISKIPSLKNSHFLLMIDDAHDLNQFQKRTINSWVAFRDHSIFSFKIATAKVNRPELITVNGGSILEGHDFITIDMEKPFQNSFSDFYKLAKDIIERRLLKNNVEATAEEFFPVNPNFEKDMIVAEEETRRLALIKYPNGTSKQIADYVYKYKRAQYFRSRPAKANLPPYSGFQLLVDISTGVIRNLLDPCYYMYESELDKHEENIKLIPYSTQSKLIIERSKAMWKRLNDGLHQEIEGCSVKQSTEIYHLFDNLMILFEKRLLNHKSEPRAITFTISQKDTADYNHIQELLIIAQKAQILYTRLSNAKDDGKQENYYVINKILFPSRGLDPHGQYARVSLKSKDLYLAAVRNQNIPFLDDDTEPILSNGSLFNDN